MRVTIIDVAEKAGVSPSTVSRVLGNNGYVSEESRQKVQAAIDELGYRPNALARSLVTNSTRTIGVIITDILNPFFATLVDSIEKVTWQAGYNIFLSNTNEDIKRERAILSALLEKQVDGLIVVPVSNRSAEHLRDIPVPLVLVDRYLDKFEADEVVSDNENGAYRAVKHLVEQGHREISILIDQLDVSSNAERFAGYRRALSDSGISFDEKNFQPCEFTQQSAYERALQILTSSPRPTALFTANNFMTLGALRAIDELRLNIPKDVALVAFDELENVGVNCQPLTTVIQPVREMGQIAAQRLLSRLQGDSVPPIQVRLKTRFIVRSSSSLPLHTGADPLSH